MLITVLGLMLLAATGCGPRLIPVDGVVRLDGNVLSEAFVAFTPSEGGRPISTVTDDAGGFAVSTDRGDGLLPGKYRIAVSKVALADVPPESLSEDGLMPADFDPSGMTEKWVTPKRYAKLSTSGLEVEVKSGMDPVELELVSK